ncbi:MAG: xylulokinase [Candidatus Baldrarchaeia archaeon]
MKTEYVLSIDIGTTGCKTVLADVNGNIVAKTFKEYITYTPKPGYSEQDPNDWWKAVVETVKSVISQSKVDPKEAIIGLGFSGTLGGVLPIDKNGNLLMERVIHYSDMRAIVQCEFLRKVLGEKFLYNTTGNPLLPIPSLVKWLWIKDNKPEVFEKTYKFLHPKDYMVFKTTGEIFTDYVVASSTMAFDLVKRCWSEEILETVKIPVDKLPMPQYSMEIAGELKSDIAKELGLRAGLPVIVGSGDTGALLVGAGAIKDRYAVCYLGSAAEIDLASNKPFFDPKMRVPIRCHAIPNMWFGSATSLTAGIALKWFRNEFCELEMMFEKKFGVDAYKLLDKQAENVPIGSRGLIFLPYLLGERSPISDPKARGAFIGISLSNKREDFFRAMLEGISFTLRHNLETYREINMAPIDLRMCGGGAKSNLWRKIIVNVLGMECKLLENPGETTAIGIATCILTGVKIYDNIEKAVKNFVKIKGVEKPVFEEYEKYDKLFKIYLKCYPALREIMHALYDISRK